MKEKVREIQA